MKNVYNKYYNIFIVIFIINFPILNFYLL